MAELLVEYSDVALKHGGREYLARAWGEPREDGKWEGWIEFVDPVSGDALRSGRETTQPNRGDTIYWASGLTAVYLEGAFERALNLADASAPPRPGARHRRAPPDGPDPGLSPADSVLDPFSVYRNGETLLRRQLAAMSPWHLVNIIEAHDLSDLSRETLDTLAAAELIELIVTGVRNRRIDPRTR